MIDAHGAFEDYDFAQDDQARANGTTSKPAPALPKALDVAKLLALEIPPREFVLEPILRQKETAMLHAWRGVGKTYFGLNLAFAVATGGQFFTWKAPRPRRVLYIDGEMPARTMQERLAVIVSTSEPAGGFDPENLRLVCADLQDEPLVSLATTRGQQLLDPHVADADLVILDSISTLAGAGRENEAESWLPMQEWALELRRRDKCVLLMHHDGKGGQQRGTSRREDILDLVIHLRRPADYQPQEGARFEVHFPKGRGLIGEDVKPFEAALQVVGGRAEWTTRPLDEVQLVRAAALYRDGCSANDVAQELGVSRATAYRLKAKAKEQGLL